MYLIALGLLALVGAIVLNRSNARTSAYTLLFIAAVLIIAGPAMACDSGIYESGGVGVDTGGGVVFQERVYSSPIYSQQLFSQEVIAQPVFGYQHRSAAIVVQPQRFRRSRAIVVQPQRIHHGRAAIVIGGGY